MNRSKSKLPVKRQRANGSSLSQGKLKATKARMNTSAGSPHQSGVPAITTSIPPSTVKADAPLVSNPASNSKRDAIRDKEREVEEVTKVKDMSADLLNYFRDLADNVKELAENAQTESKSLENWHHIFTMMGEMHHNRDMNKSKVWVRLKSNAVDKAPR